MRADALGGWSPRTVLLLTLGFLVLWFYRSNTSPWGAVFVGEDFPVFWWQAYAHPLRSLVTPYAGYLHLVPRLAGTASVFAPNIGAPLLFILTYTVALVISVAALLIASPRLGVLTLLCLLIAPNTGEVFASITYFQWIAAPILVALSLGEFPRDAMRRGVVLTALVLLGLSGPFAAILLPFVLLDLLRTWPKRQGLSLLTPSPIGLAIVACGLLSVLVFVVVGSSQVAGGSQTHYAKLAGDGFRQVFAVLADGGVANQDWRAAAVAACAGICLVLPGHRREKLFFGGFAAIVFAMALHKFRFDPDAFANPAFGTRYFFIAIFAILVVFALSIRVQGVGRYVGLVGLVLVAIGYPYRSWQGPERIAVDWHAQRGAIDARRWTSVFVNPFWEFVVVRTPEGSQQLYWMKGLVRPEALGAPSIVPLQDGSRIHLEGQVSAPGTCGFAIPTVANPGIPTADEHLLVRVRSHTGSSVAPPEAYDVPTINLGDWSAFKVGTSLVGPQTTSIDIEPIVSRTLHVGLVAQRAYPQWEGEESSSGTTFPGMVWAMECTTDSPFGPLGARKPPKT